MTQVKLVEKKCLFCDATDGVVLAKNKEESVAVCAARHLIPLLKKWEEKPVTPEQN